MAPEGTGLAERCEHRLGRAGVPRHLAYTDVTTAAPPLEMATAPSPSTPAAGSIAPSSTRTRARSRALRAGGPVKRALVVGLLALLAACGDDDAIAPVICPDAGAVEAGPAVVEPIDAGPLTRDALAPDAGAAARATDDAHAPSRVRERPLRGRDHGASPHVAYLELNDENTFDLSVLPVAGGSPAVLQKGLDLLRRRRAPPGRGARVVPRGERRITSRPRSISGARPRGRRRSRRRRRRHVLGDGGTARAWPSA